MLDHIGVQKQCLSQCLLSRDGKQNRIGLSELDGKEYGRENTLVLNPKGFMLFIIRNDS